MTSSIPGAWIMIDGALVRRDVTDVDVWVEWRSHVEKVIEAHRRTTYPIPPDMRLGQKVAYTLEDFGRSDLELRTAGFADRDPYNNDDNIPAFLEYVDEMWETYNWD